MPAYKTPQKIFISYDTYQCCVCEKEIPEKSIFIHLLDKKIHLNCRHSFSGTNILRKPSEIIIQKEMDRLNSIIGHTEAFLGDCPDETF